MSQIVFLGFFIQQIGLIACLRDTLRGKTKPNRISFFLWALPPLIGTAAALTDGVTWAVLPVFGAGFGLLLVFLASFMNKKAYWEITTFDWICAAFSITALALWLITKEPAIAILFAILADASAALPVLKKCWTHPHTETSVFYLTALFSQGSAFFAMKDYSFVEMAFPIYLITISTILFAIIWTGQRRKASPVKKASLFSQSGG
jgi:hypothetical protein